MAEWESGFPNGGDTALVANDGYGGGDDRGCFNCGQQGHRKMDCPEPPNGGGMTGECYNCGEIGHNKADCPNPRVERAFTGACHNCGEDGHRAAECPSAPARKCRACGEQGHEASECNNARMLYDSSVPQITPEEAWKMLTAADSAKDITMFKDAMNAYTMSMPEITFQQMERELRAAKMNIHLVAKEQEVADTMTVINLQGKKGCKFVVSFQLSYKPSRPKFASGWPSSPEENMERLANAGYIKDAWVTKCRNCGELGHIQKACPQDKAEREKSEVKCANCQELGHYVRDCPQPRQDRNTCRNCGQPGHKASDCDQERSAANVECRHCNEMGHFAKDCPTREPQTCRNCGQEGHKKADCPEPARAPRTCRNCNAEDHIARDCPEPINTANVQCRNCDQMGHMSKECPKPRDYSRVQCRNCGQMGHTPVRCPKPLEDNSAGGTSEWPAKGTATSRQGQNNNHDEAQETVAAGGNTDEW